ncbi:Trk K+ transport system NAD-binding subunit [Allocatelliglobosispora scoriae]|uniref:Trk K+ transport system NAD-binding subunit n=1 Tax=Allocatelliglobosispora scoriae TaxID=643052 RepID=A0A841C200_9ACTN|nr:NAD-binding protein [Allocatelliglobosispora scoriae]MBB5873906.1 Trk K+ transport system NAD-binding subunit [Allocatelliglobosispora scoriae]
MTGSHFVICGFDGLALRLTEQLTGRYATDVVVLMTAEQQQAARGFDGLARVRIAVVDRLDARTLSAAGLDDAAGLALTMQDDVGNIHLALQAREAAPRLRLVVRMYNTSLAHSIEPLLGNCKVLSDAEIAAPALVASALREVAANPVVVAKRTLIVARRDDVPPEHVVCTLADTTAAGGTEVLPAGGDLVLADHRPGLAAAPVPGAPRRRRKPWAGVIGTFVATIFSRKARIAVTVVLGLIAAAGTALGISLRLSPAGTFYQVMTVVLGGPQATTTYTHWQKTLQLVLGAAGLALLPLITALVVEGIVRARLAVAQVRLRQPQSDHIVVVGLGGVGTRVLRLLHDRGLKMVAIARDEQDRGVQLARELAIPLVIGDPSRETTLRTAGVDRCRALMAITSADASNLETALHGRNLQPRLHVVLRVFDGDLARHVRRTFDLPYSRSVSYLAAPAFAEALMGREVIGTISVERRVLLIAEVRIRAGSALDGARIADADEPGHLRVIALAEFGEPRPLWKPSPERRLREGDRLTIVGTRDGVSHLMRQATERNDS